MGYQRLVYDEHDSTRQMHEDCTACGSQIAFTQRVVGPLTVSLEAPSLEFETFPLEVHKAEIEVSDAAAHLASRLHLHLD